MHLKKVFVNNDYPEAFLSATLNPIAPKPREERKKQIIIPYVKGLSEDIRRVCRKFDIKVVFRSGVSLRSKLSKVKDKLPSDQNSNVVCNGCQRTFRNFLTFRGHVSAFHSCDVNISNQFQS